MRTKTVKTSLTALVLIAAILMTQAAAFARSKPLTRQEINEKYKWKLEDLYVTSNTWYADFQKVQTYYIPAFQQYKGKLNNASQVLQCLKLQEEMLILLEKIYQYSHLKADENQADSEASELSSKAETLYSQAAAAIAFIQPELLEQPESVINSFIADPLLSDYRQFLLAIQEKKEHTLSRGEEELLALSSDMAGSPGEIYSKITTADMKYPKILDDKGKEVQLSNGVYSAILVNKDRAYRKRGFEAVYESYGNSLNALASTLYSEVKKNIFYAKARKYDSALEASLAGEDIPRTVFDNLIKSVNNNVNYLHKYVQLRKKALGVEKVHIYDMYVPLTDSYEQTIPYEGAQKMILEGLAPLGKEYLDLLRTGFDSRWIDVYETPNKTSGGYQWSTYGIHPYVLLNYSDTTSDMLTLAHEMGHALNSYYTNNAQKYINSNIPIFTAEVASTTNEILMLKYLIKNSKSDDEKLYYLNKLIEDIRGSVYTQVMYSEFEKNIHERVEQGEALSAKTMNEIWKGLMEKYYGDEFVVDEQAQFWWARIPHFYKNFYVYKYATSMSVSYEISKNLSEEKGVKEYIEFLKAGSAQTPIETIKKVGVDMNSSQAVDNMMKEFGELVDQMEALLEKQGKLKQVNTNNSSIAVAVNGQAVSLKHPVKKIREKTYIDIEMLKDILGAQIEWDSGKSICVITRDNRSIVFAVNKSEVFANGKKLELDYPVTEDGSRVMIPIRLFAEELGATVDWDSGKFEICIHY